MPHLRTLLHTSDLPHLHPSFTPSSMFRPAVPTVMIQQLYQALQTLRARAPEEPDTSPPLTPSTSPGPTPPPARVSERQYPLGVGVVHLPLLRESSAAASPAPITPCAPPGPTPPPARVSEMQYPLGVGVVNPPQHCETLWLIHRYIVSHLQLPCLLLSHHLLRLDSPHLQLGSPNSSTLWGWMWSITRHLLHLLRVLQSPSTWTIWMRRYSCLSIRSSSPSLDERWENSSGWHLKRCFVNGPLPLRRW